MKAFRSVALAAALFGMVAPAFAEVALECNSSDGKYLVRVFDEPLPQGEVFIDGRLATFGELTCGIDAGSFDCHSERAADAGFAVRLRSANGGRYAGTLSEVLVTGERQLATLTCR